MNVFEPKPYTGKTAFEQWAEYEGAPMIRDFIVPDLRTIALKPCAGPPRRIRHMACPRRAGRSALDGRLHLRDFARQSAEAAAPSVRGADFYSKRRRRDDGVERRRQIFYL